MNQILNTSDPLKRAEIVIDLAKRILGADQSIFVTPDDIVSVSVCYYTF
jgi:hypothetical protein